MGCCEDVRGRLAALAVLRPEEMPPEVREHLEGCALCARAMVARRAMQETLEALLLQRENTRRGMADGTV